MRDKASMRERVLETFDPENGGPQPPADAKGRVLEAVVAFVLGAGFWRLIVTDSWVASAVFGVLLAGVLFAYGLLRRRLAEDAGRDDRRPPRPPRA
jgi:hypothetical protein